VFVITEFVITEFVITEFVITEFVITEFDCISLCMTSFIDAPNTIFNDSKVTTQR
jgi:hypothetical protein